MIVESVDLSGAAAGVANVYVKRGNGYSTAAVDAGTVTTILSEYKITLMQNTIADGGNAPNPIDFEPSSEQNYAQLFSRVWGETSTQGAMQVYGKETMEQKGARNRREFFREVENALFDGRKGKHAIGGYSQWTTGGAVEYVPGATAALDGTTRLVDFGGAFDIERQREIDEITYRYGNGMQIKDWFVGGQYFTVLYNALEKFITVNDALSKRYGWRVYELELGHGLARLHRHPKFTDDTTANNTYSKDAVILDLDYLNLMVMAEHDVQVRSNIQANRAHKREDEIFAQLGLYRRFPTAHAVIYGITA
jgi:hypothetical protein